MRLNDQGLPIAPDTEPGKGNSGGGSFRTEPIKERLVLQIRLQPLVMYLEQSLQRSMWMCNGRGYEFLAVDPRLTVRGHPPVINIAERQNPRDNLFTLLVVSLDDETPELVLEASCEATLLQ